MTVDALALRYDHLLEEIFIKINKVTEDLKEYGRATCLSLDPPLLYGLTKRGVGALVKY